MARTLRALAGAVLALCLGITLIASGPVSWADDTGGSGQQSDQSTQQSTQSGQQQITVNDSIIDTGNLLGSKLSEVMDSIDKVKQKTGATLRLMYLPHLDTQGDAEAWCRQVLDTSGAAPNTVLLAVASQDGNLVSCVSSGSDDWLNKNVQSFADAALKPIAGNDDPDWGGAAIALADKIIESKETTASHTMVTIGVGAAVAVLVLLVALGLVFMRRKKRRRRHAGERARGKESGRSGRRPRRHGDAGEAKDGDADDSAQAPEDGDAGDSAREDGRTAAAPAVAPVQPDGDASPADPSADADAAAATSPVPVDAAGAEATASPATLADSSKEPPAPADDDDPLAKYRP